MPFENSITGGQGALVRPAIKSPNYVPGVSGWSINKDGSAEFTSLIIDGGSLVSITITFTDGSQIHIYAGAYIQQGGGPINGAWTTFLPKPQPGATWAPGSIGAQSAPGGPSANLEIFSPYDSAHADQQSSIILGNGQGIGQSLIAIDADICGVDAILEVIGTGHYLHVTAPLTVSDIAIRTDVGGDTQGRLVVQVDGKLIWGSGAAAGDTNLYRAAADTLQTDDDLIVAGGRSIPRGIMLAPTTTGSNGTTTSGTTETRDTVLGNYQFTAAAGRRYRVTYSGCKISGTVLTDLYTLNIRNGGNSTPTSASTLIASSAQLIGATGGPGQQTIPCSATFAPGAGTVTLGAFLLRSAGAGTATPVGTRELYVEDIGPST